MTQPDGLGDLTARRARAIQRTPRVAPPTRHPRAATPGPEPLAAEDKPNTEEAGKPATPTLHVAADAPVTSTEQSSPEAPPKPPARRTSPRPSASASEAAKTQDAENDGPLRLGQFYVDGPSDRWLNELRAKALVERGDRSLSASAVVRLALRTLREQMTQEQILDALGPGAVAGEGRRGRPRR